MLLKLTTHQLLVLSSLLQQFLVCSHFHNLSLAYHHNHVSVLHCAQSVRNYNHSLLAFANQVVKSFLDQMF